MTVRYLCTLTVGDAPDQIPHAALGLAPQHGIRHTIELAWDHASLRATLMTFMDTGLPCELQLGTRESCVGRVSIDLHALRGRIDTAIARVRERLARDVFDTRGCEIDAALCVLLSSSQPVRLAG
jgi:hypothetical protein